jgi:hypothetical protein
MAFGLKKISLLSVFRTFFSLFTDIHKFWYLVHWFAILRWRSSSSLVLINEIFTKLWPLDLEKYNELSFFFFWLQLCSPPPPPSPPLLALQSQVVTNQNLVLLCLNYFWLNMPSGGDLLLLAILSKCLFLLRRTPPLENISGSAPEWGKKWHVKGPLPHETGCQTLERSIILSGEVVNISLPNRIFNIGKTLSFLVFLFYRGGSPTSTPKKKSWIPDCYMYVWKFDNGEVEIITCFEFFRARFTLVYTPVVLVSSN